MGKSVEGLNPTIMLKPKSLSWSSTVQHTLDILVSLSILSFLTSIYFKNVTRDASQACMVDIWIGTAEYFSLDRGIWILEVLKFCILFSCLTTYLYIPFSEELGVFQKDNKTEVMYSLRIEIIQNVKQS